jgi:hypothetical protein
MSGIGILGTLAEPHEEPAEKVYWDYEGLPGVVLVVFKEISELAERTMPAPSYMVH